MKIIVMNPDIDVTMSVSKVRKGFYFERFDKNGVKRRHYKDLVSLITAEIGIKNLLEYGLFGPKFNDEIIKCLIEKGDFTTLDYGKWKYITIKPIHSLIKFAKEKVIKSQFYKDFYPVGEEINQEIIKKIEEDNDVLFIDPVSLVIYINEKIVEFEFTPFFFDGNEYLPLDGIAGIRINLSELKETHKDLFDYFIEVISKAKSMHDDSKEVRLYILEEDLKKQYEKTDEAFAITEGYLFFEVITRRGESDYFVL